MSEPAEVILALNAGSSSLKFALFQANDQLVPLLRSARPAAGTLADLADATRELLGWVSENYRLVAVGHRVVHGGLRFADPVRIDAATFAELEALTPLAPLHQPLNLAPIKAITEQGSPLPQVACFDTAFHRTQPEVAQRFGLPRRFHDQGLRRYGFHGLSYEYVSAELARLDPAAAWGRVIVAHLGAGASLCAIQGGRSVATTMGFSVLDGLLMATRCGSLDPGALLYLLRQGITADEMEDLLYHRSGLLGVSGISADMRALLESPAPEAREAVELFVYRVTREIGSLAAAMGGLDVLAFTGGIGEHAPLIREAICKQAAWLGLELDPDANFQASNRLHRTGSRVAAWLVPTDEERMIARHTQRRLRLA